MRARVKSQRRDVYLLRGLPGMGKSTISQALLKSTGYGERSAYCSADDYFIDHHGIYKFVREYLGTAHAHCQMIFGKALRNKTEVIVVDNTNIKRRDFEGYRKAALEHGYKFYEITVGTLNVEDSHARNTHQVPRESLAKMAESFER